MKKVFITTINFHNVEVTNNCLYSLVETDTKNIELHVIVIDNESTEELHFEQKLVDKLRIHLISNKENKGFTGGQNDGIEYALAQGADYIVILNNDVRVDKNFLQKLVASAQNHEDGGIFVPKIYFEKGREFHKDRYSSTELGKVFWYGGGIMDWNNIIASHRGVDEVDKGQFDKEEQTDVATGCCMLVKAELFKKIGLLNDKYFMYYEDNEFTQRAKRDGFKTYYCPSAIIWHMNAASGGGSGSNLQDYFITRNRLLFGFTYATSRAKFALFRESIRHLISGRPGQKQGVWDFYLKKFGKGSFIK